MAVTIEQLLDKIAEGLITNMHVIADGTELETLQANQHTIKQGIMQVARETNDKLILWQQDVKANVNSDHYPHVIKIKTKLGKDQKQQTSNKKSKKKT